MTAQEQQLISGLIERVRGTQLPEKDAEAEHLLQQGLGQNPDSLYILAQTVLVQQYALDQAQKQLADARQQMEELRQQSSQTQQQPPQKHTSFLGSIFGTSDPTPAPPPPPPAPAQGQGYAPVQGYNAGYAPAGYSPAQGYAPAGGLGAPMQGGGGGGFLRGAAQTAAGVAAGALAFEGVESLLHGFGHEASGFGGFGGGGGRPEEIVTNNYYGDEGRGRDGSSSDLEDRRADGGDPGSNIFTGDGDRANFAGTDSNDDGQDSTYDDGDSLADDGGSTDDGGDDSSFDDGGTDQSDDSSF